MKIVYDSFLLQVLLTACFALGLLIPAISLFIRPAKRTIRASLVNAANGHIVDISSAETSIGRSNTCDLILTDGTVSRFHAVLSYRQKEWMIFDTHSTAGVLVNGQKIENSAGIKDGDRLRFGQTDFIFFSTAVTTREETVKRYRGASERSAPQYRSPAPQYRLPSQKNTRGAKQPGQKNVPQNGAPGQQRGAPRFRPNTTGRKVNRPK